ncbi:MAG: bifunctional 3-deoxy-7-phosphoheptulonate synthase/chorismate mutase type II [Prevotellaceae bacterium]|jgi:chorismate mutase|nr:bifunctional 3-deoxy-7-phosphoheptulonate synthase/chorismate mutase type II [Prevotellaceae bacterium]
MTYTGTQIELDLEKIENRLEKPDWPLLIAGPCSAESEEQLMDTAVQLMNTKRVSIYRAGLWKPRTRPNMFEGVGKVGLPWLLNVKKQTGLQVATEVATPEHVELALKHDIDVLWIGARTSVNPFSVQAIADALKGTNATVLVKNPVNPDLQLWIGALERINRVGIKRLAAVHRGFSSHEKTVFRNAPMWNIPIELKAACPGLPVICDPSHICGNAGLIPMLAQKALDMDMAGLMIECHNKPECAMSDAGQQLLPTQYGNMIRNLILRSASPAGDAADAGGLLRQLREEIDVFDDELIQKLSLRMQAVAKIGRYKRDNNISILQLHRWSELVRRRIDLGQALGLSEDFLKKLLDLIHQESINIQVEIMNKEKY